MSHGAKLWLALATVYVIWGSTYLGIEMTGETIPPLFAVSVRFILAGSLLAGLVAWRRGGARALRVTRRELGAAALIGLLLPGANALLFVAERSVPTGLSSLVIAAVPLWLVVLRTVTGDRPARASLAGVVVGFVGVALLLGPGGETGSALGLVLVVASSVTWAVGSFVSPRLPLPRDAFVATALEMLAGGLFLLPVGLLAATPHPSEFSARSLVAFAYLVVFGSIVGYTAYVWLLANAPIGTVSTYAYVNPVVAILLGWLVLGESLTARIAVGAAIVLASVAIVVRHDVPREPAPVTGEPASE